MQRNDWNRIEELFLAAVELPVKDRARFLDENCSDDPALRREVESLLQADMAGDQNIVSAISANATSMLDESPFIGQRLGAYRVMRSIGSGGMGVVYLAERDDQHFAKRVAVKVVKRGMDTEDVLRRFRNERQILANLEHPYIGRLIDGGSTKDGRPYFVMEFVDGLPIDKYCAAHRLDVRQRLLLFLRICEAVTHAHHAHIVHRDLKPSNILITADGVPKLLDFGVAKLLTPNSESTVTSIFSAPLTPEYASPEQVLGLPITAETDVYALGIILYELIAQQRGQTLTTKTPVEIERIVCRTELPKPSESLRHAERRVVKGDLDNIVLKAARKDKAQRYQTVEALSKDVQQFLAGMPVSARNTSAFYRARKALWRHRLGAGSALAVAASLAAAGFVIFREPKSAPVLDTPGPVLERLTFDTGMTMEPDLTPDGTRVVYVSDRDNAGNFELWTQAVKNGTPRRLTETSGDERSPRFSPDGTKIAYAIERSTAGGVFIMSSNGGPSQRLADNGSFPHFSPDGKSIVFMTGGSIRSVSGVSIAIVPADGGPSRVISSGLTMVGIPVWSPDGNYVLTRGMTKDGEAWKARWYAISARGGTLTPLDIEETLSKANVSDRRGSMPTPLLWRGKWALLTGQLGDANNIFGIGISLSTLKPDGSIRRFTSGTDTFETDPSISNDGQMAFASHPTERQLFELSVKSGVRTPDSLVPIAAGMRRFYGMSTATDGKAILYTTESAANRGYILRDQITGQERQLSSLDKEPVLASPILSPDASAVALARKHATLGHNDSSEFVVHKLDGQSRVVCADCGTPFAWFADGRNVLTYASTGDQRTPLQLQWLIVDSTNSQRRAVVPPPGTTLNFLSISQDAQWAVIRLTKLASIRTPADEVALTYALKSAPSATSYTMDWSIGDLYLAPLSTAGLGPMSEWVPVPVRTFSSRMAWVPDLSALYYFETNGDRYSVMKIPLERQRSGPAFRVSTPRPFFRFDQTAFIVYEESGIIAAGNKLIVSGQRSKGNIWLTKLSPPD